MHGSIPAAVCVQYAAAAGTGKPKKRLEKPQMNTRIDRASLWLAIIVSVSSLAPRPAEATIVEFQTVMGNFEVNLYDNATPATVANFLNYLNNGAFSDSIFHRSVPGFVIQGGGFHYNGTAQFDAIATNAPVVNEPQFANVRGTIAMAKLGGDPDSATSQWFFNLSDNTANLDGQNGGFSVFGQVVGNGMDVVDAIAALPTFAFSSPFGDLPLQNYTQTDFDNLLAIDDTHLMIVTAIIISDSTVDSAAGLNPQMNTSTPSGGGGLGGGGGGGGGGGAIGFFGLLALILAWPMYRNRVCVS